MQHSRVPPRVVIFVSAHSRELTFFISASVDFGRLAEEVEVAVENLKGDGAQAMDALMTEGAKIEACGGVKRTGPRGT
jgi:hypothetical protein